MEVHWLAVLSCLSLLAAPGHLAAVPTQTQDTLVVARSDDATSESEPVTSEQPTTEGPLPPIKLTEMEVISEVSLRYAHTVVVARVRNPARRAQEANFRVLLPETAFISGFLMTLDDKSYKAYVKEKEEAKQIYNDAVSHGYGAAHIAAKARDSNQFVVSVNVEPSSTAVFNLTYEELLVRRNNVYNHAINLHPGALVPKLSVTVNVKEAQKITELRVPEIRTGNEIDATKDDAQNTKAVITRGHDDREATITFTPDLEEQKRLMQVYADKSKESASHKSYRVWGQPEDDSANANQPGVLGQFVVQYDVERPKDGEILVNDGYFVHFFAPTSLPPLNKYVVLVLDTSGSMMDRKIVQLREAMQTILSDLNPGDYFSIVEFASSVTIHELKEADQEPPKKQYYWGEVEKAPTLVPPSPATADNINKAKVIVSRLSAAGGTNIDSALDVAVNLVHKRTEWGKRPKPASNGTESADNSTGGTTKEVAAADNGDDVYNVERMKNLEPIIIFLTDGDPTVGVTSTASIISRLTEKNYGEGKATIFSLAFGEDADRKFLRKLSLRHDGFMRHIYEAADAALQLRDFYRQVSSPLLADVKFIYPADQVKEGTVTKNKFRTLYAGGEVVVAGQVARDVAELTPQVSAFCGVEDGYGKKRFEKLPKAPIPALRSLQPLERLWSYLTIRQLLDERDASEGDELPDKDNSPEKKALALALKYEFVTPLTSLVVVKPNDTKAVNAESVDKPNSLPFSTQSIHGMGYPGSPGVPSGGSPLSFSSYTSSAIAGPPGVFASPQSLFFDSMVEEEEVDQYDFLQQSEGPPVLANRMAYRPYRPGKPMLSLASHQYHQGALAYGNMEVSRIVSGSSVTNDYDDIDSASAHDSLPSVVPHSVVSTTAVPARAESPVEAYSLQEYSWAAALLNASADALVFDVNGTRVSLKLTKDTEVPKTAGGDLSCERAVSGDGGAGLCVYLTRCESAKHISADTYKASYCTLDHGYAGVCCSSQKVDLITVR